MADALIFQWVRRLSRRVREMRLLGTAATLLLLAGDLPAVGIENQDARQTCGRSDT